MSRKRLSLALTAEAYEMLEKLAKGEGLTITGYLEMIVRRLSKESSKKNA